MNRNIGFSLAAICGFTAIIVAALLPVQPTSGQEQRMQSPPPPQAQPAPRPNAQPSSSPEVANIKIFKSGNARPRPTKRPQPPGNPPSDLSVSDLAASVKAIFGDTPPEKLLHTKLTTRHGYEAGKAWMTVEKDVQYLYDLVPNAPNGVILTAGVLHVHFAAKANQTYMLDLAYDTTDLACTSATPGCTPNCHFTVTGPDNVKQTIACTNSGHLVVGFYSTTTGTQSFSFENSEQWYIYSVAISA